MVKNTKGGKGAKGLARKNSSQPTSNEKLRISTEDLEQYACVTKMFGNGMCEVTLNNKSKLMGHIRGAFRGRQKHKNWITSSSIVLVGLRDWEEQSKNCDILYVYDDIQIEQLKYLPNIDIKNILQLKIGFSSSGTEASSADIVFSNETEEDVKTMLENTQTFDINKQEEVNIDDI